MIARLRGGPDVDFGPRQHVERAQQILAREAAGQFLEPFALVLAGDLGVVDPRRIDGQHEQVADHTRQLAAHGAQVVPGLDRPRGQRERGGSVLVRHRLHRVEQQVATDQTEHRRHVLGRQRRDR